jgi:hypothetical protein
MDPRRHPERSRRAWRRRRFLVDLPCRRKARGGRDALQSSARRWPRPFRAGDSASRPFALQRLRRACPGALRDGAHGVCRPRSRDRYRDQRAPHRLQRPLPELPSRSSAPSQAGATTAPSFEVPVVLSLDVGIAADFASGSFGEIGGCSRTRTCGPLIKSQLLYQLSYAPPPRVAGVYNKALAGCR